VGHGVRIGNYEARPLSQPLFHMAECQRPTVAGETTRQTVMDGAGFAIEHTMESAWRSGGKPRLVGGRRAHMQTSICGGGHSAPDCFEWTVEPAIVPRFKVYMTTGCYASVLLLSLAGRTFLRTGQRAWF